MAGLLFSLIRKALRRGGDDDGDPNEPLVARVHRRKRLEKAVVKYMPHLRYALLVVGYAWLLALPWPHLGRNTYIDEHALQPGQVVTKWNWDDVHAADRYLEQMEALRAQNTSKDGLTQWLKDEFKAIGLAASTQNYAFFTLSGVVNGTNTYAVFPAPRSSGAEAIVVSASSLSRIDQGQGTLNERGIPTVLALARFLTKYSYWAKDLVFVISDGYLDGMQAWLSSYHGTSQSNLHAQPLELTSGVIWTAVNIDYPGHSFSHLGLFYEGLNGRLPNQDLMNSISLIATHNGGVPVVLYDHTETPFSLSQHHGKPDWQVLAHKDVDAYFKRARHILRYFTYHLLGRPSGVHGLFHQFRVDAITVFAVPAVGPHGFYSLGKLVESSLRTMNNLLERLHASFFFYLMTGPSSFLKIGLYLPSAIILSIAITITGLSIWHQAGLSEYDPHAAEAEGLRTEKEPQDKLVLPPKVTMDTFVPKPRRRPTIEALLIMLATHLLGSTLLLLVRFDWFVGGLKVFSLPVVATFVVAVFTSPPYIINGANNSAPLHLVLQSFTLLFSGMVISIIAVLNFALAASLGAIFGLPLVAAGPRSPRVLKLLLLALAVPVFASPAMIKSIVWEWDILGGWFLPFACLVYAPILLQSWIAAVCHF